VWTNRREVRTLWHMLKPSRKTKQTDENELGVSMLKQGNYDDLANLVGKAQAEGKDLAAVILGRRGGLKGGRARAEKLTAEERRAIARKAAAARWHSG